MAWLTGYDYRKSVTLSRASGAVSNYQMKLLLGESSGAIGEDVDCGGHCLSTFNDIRFTTSDGETLLDYWIESVTGATPNQLATIWIEFDSIGTSDTTFYMYYGNSGASAVSNGANTFLFFDDFERGSNGDPVGGDWDKEQGTEEISTTNDVGDLTGFTGSRSLKVVGSATQLRLPILATLPDDGTFAIRANIYKPDATNVIQLSCRKNNYYAAAQIQIDGKIYWLNSSLSWIYSNNIANEDSWDSVLELRNVNFSAKTYEVYYNNSLVASATSMSAPAGADYYVYIAGSPNNGHDSWIDNVIVRHYRATEPAWGTWSAEQELAGGTTESAVGSDAMVGIATTEYTTESAGAMATFDGYSLSSSTTESAEATDTFGNERTAYGPTTESAEVTDSMDALHLVDSITESAIVSGSMEAAEIIRKRIRFPNLQGKHLSLKFTSSTDGSFAIYYLRHKMFKTRELCSDQKHPNTQGSHIGVKLSNSGSDAFTLMYVSEKMQLVTT